MGLAEHLDILMLIVAIAALMSGYPVAFTLAGVALLFAFLGAQFGVFDLALLSTAPQRVYGVINNQVLLAVPLFVFMGVMLEKSKVAEELLDTMGRLFGAMRGGLGISVIVVGALMAASTGIVGATVVTMGLLSLPTMLKRGYSPSVSAGAIAASGTLGQIIPPSIVLVLLADVVSNAYQQAQRARGSFAPEPVSVGDLFAGAIVPGLLLVALYLAYLGFLAWRRPDALPATPPEPGARTDLAHVAHAIAAPLALMIAVLGSILSGIATPTQAAAVGAAGATFLAGARQDLGRGFAAQLTKTATLTGAAALVGLFAINAVFDLRLGLEAGGGFARLATLGLAFVLAALAALGFIAAIYRLWPSRCAQDVAQETARITSMVFVILIGATIFSLVFVRGFGGDDLVEGVLEGSAGAVIGAASNIIATLGFDGAASALATNQAAQAGVAIFVVMGVMFVLGFFLDFLEITFVVVPLVAPPLFMLGVDPVWLGVMMALNLQTSFLTPPFGFALFYLRGVAPPEVSTIEIYRGAAPFVGIQLFALALIALFPWIVTWAS